MDVANESDKVTQVIHTPWQRRFLRATLVQGLIKIERTFTSLRVRTSLWEQRRWPTKIL